MNRTIVSVAAGVMLFAGAVSVAAAQEIEKNAKVEIAPVSAQEITQENEKPVPTLYEGKAADSASRDNEAGKKDEAKDPVATSTHGAITAAEHRSSAATFAQSLRAIADHEDDDLSDGMRAIAHEHETLASSTAEAMAKVESRGSFKSFLVGGDYKNLGVIRSSIATTSTAIAELSRMQELSWSSLNKEQLGLQIQALKDTQSKLTAYVQAHDGFSLFGWVRKMFGDK